MIFSWISAKWSEGHLEEKENSPVYADLQPENADRRIAVTGNRSED
jgi:hypothetical protein